MSKHTRIPFTGKMSIAAMLCMVCTLFFLFSCSQTVQQVVYEMDDVILGSENLPVLSKSEVIALTVHEINSSVKIISVIKPN